MINSSTFCDLVSGRRRGIAAELARTGLGLLEWPYRGAVRLRNLRYDRGRAEVHRAGVPVVSVGNLTLGGTGKTPLVEWIARTLRQQQVRVSIISRGYGAAEGQANDEALELELALPDVPHLQNPNRVEATEIAVEELATQLIVLDDGFQHRRLARDLDLVLLDATEPFGFEHVFPRGTLREPIAGLSRADVVVLSRADMIDVEQRVALKRRVLELAPQAAWCEVVHRPMRLVNVGSEQRDCEQLCGRQIAAFCGIGNPRGFRHTLESLGGEVAHWKEFPDHYQYSRDDVAQLVEWATGAEIVLCTRKDLVKLQLEKLGQVSLWAVNVELEFLTGEADLRQRLANVSASIASD